MRRESSARLLHKGFEFHLLLLRENFADERHILLEEFKAQPLALAGAAGIARPLFNDRLQFHALLWGELEPRFERIEGAVRRDFDPANAYGFRPQWRMARGPGMNHGFFPEHCRLPSQSENQEHRVA